jgi:catalase
MTMPTMDNGRSDSSTGTGGASAERSETRNTIDLLKRNPGQVMVIGLVLAAVICAFTYTGGFFSPHRISANRLADAIEANGGGPARGFRRAHAKGICVAGTFLGTAEARTLSRAALFLGGVVPVTGRFAEAASDPYTNDATTVPVRSMALRLQPTDADEWRLGMNDTPGLHVSTPQAFYENVVASTPDPQTGKPDPAKIQAYLDKHPETVAFLARLKARPLSTGFANDSYNSIDGFIFVSGDGSRRLVRWTMQAEDPFSSLSPDDRANGSANYVFDDLLARVARGPIKWRLIATIAMPADPNKAAELWPEDRQRVTLGELTIDRVESETAGNCRDVNYDPLVLPPGIDPSDDPIPFARSAVYSASFTRRSGEAKPPSAVANQSAGTRQ